MTTHTPQKAAAVPLSKDVTTRYFMKFFMMVSIVVLCTPFAASAHTRTHRTRVVAPATTTTVATPVTQTVLTPVPSGTLTGSTQVVTIMPIAAPTTAIVSPAIVVNTPVSTGATLPRSSALCMNYGHQPTQSDGSYDMAQVDAHFAILKNSGITCLRLTYFTFNDPNTELLALRAQAQGIAVIIGGNWGMVNASDLATYDAQALTQAAWAQLHGIQQMSIGNEQEYRLGDITPTQWAQHLGQLATQVHAVYSGLVSYETSSDFLPVWQQTGLGGLDLIGLNNYCGVGCNGGRIASAIQSFGATHVYVSETNADMGTGLYTSDQAHATEAAGDVLVLLNTYPVPEYYFDFVSGGAAPANWGLYSGTTLVQPLTAAVLGIKP